MLLLLVLVGVFDLPFSEGRSKKTMSGRPAAVRSCHSIHAPLVSPADAGAFFFAFSLLLG